MGFVLDPEAATEPDAPPRESTGPGPAREENGVPVGYARTKEGAAAAATNFNLLSGRDDLLDVDAIGRAMQTFAAPSWIADAASQAGSGAEYIIDTYGDDADVTASVLRYHVTDFSETDATVRFGPSCWLLAQGDRNVEEVWASRHD